MAQHLYVVTGASRGLGAAMVEQLMAPDHTLLCIARHTRQEFTARAEAHGAHLEQWAADLGQTLEVAARLQAWLVAFDPVAVAGATLINNAAVLTQIGPLDSCTDAELSTAMRVNLEAPLLLAAAFLRATHEWTGPRRILNISSGNGRRAMAGQAPYSAAKAGMDHCSRVVALDEAKHKNGAKIVSLAPGVIDTDMQAHLRAADPRGFPDKAMFVGWKESGQLASGADAAKRVLAYLNRPDFGSNPVADVRDA